MKLLALALALGVAACGTLPGAPEVVTPEAAGIVVEVMPISGAVEHWNLDSGATVEYDLNRDVIAYQNKPPAIGNLALAGHMSRAPWIMQIGPGTLESPPDCFAVRLLAFDRPDSIEFVMGPSAIPNVPAGWRVRLAKAPGFGWQPLGAPRTDGSYIENTVFCIDAQGRVAGQPPNPN
jgi:hypothetical protein